MHFAGLKATFRPSGATVGDVTRLLTLIACSPATDDGPVQRGDSAVPGPDGYAASLVLNELMAVNQSTITDESGAYADWIELYNPTSAAVSLAGFHLTDEADEPTQYALPSGQSIPVGGFTLFWADAQPEQGEDHAPFKLSGSGEYVGLFYVAGDEAAEWVDSVDFGVQAADVSHARVPDGSETWTSAAPTPGASNGQ